MSRSKIQVSTWSKPGVAIVGGGDTAAEEATYLAKLCKKVFMIHRRDELRATKCIQERCFDSEKIELKWSRTIREIKEAQAEAASALSNVAFRVGDLGDIVLRSQDPHSRQNSRLRRLSRPAV